MKHHYFPRGRKYKRNKFEVPQTKRVPIIVTTQATPVSALDIALVSTTIDTQKKLNRNFKNFLIFYFLVT